ncbi:S8 family serine peptidase [Halospeciosus flavus]|uniref:S8 family serine peptidase n=1 Tax=Halospeciosus flavus TaxID=3032283 RepID=UPI00360A8C5D
MPRLHRNGFTGENATVAVVGLGFDTSSPEFSDDVVRTKSFGSDGFDSGRHGTAVAEVVADTAPNASLILVDVDTMTQLARAADWVDAETNADVAVASLGLPVGPFDGESTLGRQIRQSDRHGTPWVVAAGNAGYRKHLNTTWRNTDGDRWLEFADGGDAVRIRSATGSVRVHVNWRDWPASDDNYDAYLQAWNGSAWVYVDQSENVQRGSQPPVEVLGARSARQYRLRIWKRSAAGNTSFDVFLNDGAQFVDHYDRAQSVKRPAVVEPVLAVGAVREGTTRLEPYSSRGPTVDGALKPEVVAPDQVDVAVYDSRPFAGTSAAAPHVAGVAALLVEASADPLSSAELRRTLRTTARDLRGTETNNRTGYGLVDAESAVDALSAVSLDACARVDAGGRYGYATDVRTVSGSCIVVTGDDARFDGNGHTLATGAEAGASAVRAANATNVTVVDARLRGRVGLNVTNGGVTLRNVSVEADEWALAVDARSTLYARDVTLANGTVGLAGTDVRLAGVGAPNATLDRRQVGPYLRLDDAPGERRENATVALRIHYGARVENESALGVWRYRDGSWTRVGGTVDSGENVVTVSLEPGGVVTLYGGSSGSGSGSRTATRRRPEPRRVGVA